MAVEEALVGPRGGREGDEGAAPGVRDDSLDAVLFEFFFFFFLERGEGGGGEEE